MFETEHHYFLSSKEGMDNNLLDIPKYNGFKHQYILLPLWPSLFNASHRYIRLHPANELSLICELQCRILCLWHFKFCLLSVREEKQRLEYCKLNPILYPSNELCNQWIFCRIISFVISEFNSFEKLDGYYKSLRQVI